MLQAVVWALVVLGTVGLGTARAGTDAFCGESVPANTVCYGPTHSLTAVRGTNNTSGAGCGGAFGYGSYFCATPAGCHTYAGVYLLTPGIRHRSSSSKSMSGYSTWGSTDPPASCVAGTPYAVLGPLAAADTSGVPVLDERAPVRAPDDVAALVPRADPADARLFHTGHGPAWVLVDGPAEQLCLVADDDGTGYGVVCARLSLVRWHGLLATLEDADQSTATGDVVIALPPAAVAGLQVERANGSVRTVRALNGAVATTLGADDVAVALDGAASGDAAAGRAQRLRMAGRRRPAAGQRSQ